MPVREKAAVRAKTEDMLERAKKHVGTVTIEIDPPGAKVLVDDIFVGESPLGHEVYVDPGKHKVVAQAEGYADGVRKFGVSPNQLMPLELTLYREDGAAVRDPSKIKIGGEDPEPQATGGGWSTQKTAVVIGGAALTVTAVTLGVIFGSKASDAGSAGSDLAADLSDDDQDCPVSGAGLDPRCGELQGHLDDQEGRAKLANVFLLGGGVVALGTAAAWIFWDSPAEPKATGWNLAPAFGPDQAHLTVSGHF